MQNKNKEPNVKIYDVNSLHPQEIKVDELMLEKMRKAGFLRRPHVKFVQRIASVQEAVFFSGGKESAARIIEWAQMHGNMAEYVNNQKGLIPEWVRIVGANIVGEPVRISVLPGFWLIYDGDGEYSKVRESEFGSAYMELAIKEEKDV